MARQLVKKRLRFREEDELALLREVLNLNPFADIDLWDDVQRHVAILTGKNFSVKTLKDHLLLIIKLFLAKDVVSKDKSGVEEDYTEKDQLCYQVHHLMGENAKKNCVSKKRKKTVNLGIINRDKFAQQIMTEETNDCLVELIEFSEEFPGDVNFIEIGENINDTITTETLSEEHAYSVQEEVPSKELDHKCNTITQRSPSKELDHKYNTTTQRSAITEKKKVLQRVRARSRRINTQRQGLDYLENYDREQNEIKKREQNIAEQKLNVEKERNLIEHRRLDLEEKKLALQEYERKKYIELLERKCLDERDDRLQLLKVIDNQEKLINVLLLKNN